MSLDDTLEKPKRHFVNAICERDCIRDGGGHRKFNNFGMPCLERIHKMKSYLRQLPHNIRYADELGKLQFEYEGNTYLIHEPADGTILVGTDPIKAGEYILYRYDWIFL